MEATKLPSRLSVHRDFSVATRTKTEVRQSAASFMASKDWAGNQALGTESKQLKIVTGHRQALNHRLCSRNGLGDPSTRGHERLLSPSKGWRTSDDKSSMSSREGKLPAQLAAPLAHQAASLAQQAAPRVAHQAAHLSKHKEDDSSPVTENPTVQSVSRFSGEEQVRHKSARAVFLPKSLREDHLWGEMHGWLESPDHESCSPFQGHGPRWVEKR